MLILGTICAYLTGAIPFAHIFTKLTTHLDIREEGSGNVGATNVFRIAGTKIACAVLMLDILKGVTVVSIIPFLLSGYLPPTQINNARLLFAASAVSGHVWPVFLNFKGGKGVATALGVCIGLSLYLSEFRLLITIAVITWIVFFIATRYVSVGSILAALSLPVTAALKGFSIQVVLLCIFLGGLISFKHSENIKRLLTKKESRISFRKPR